MIKKFLNIIRRTPAEKKILQNSYVPQNPTSAYKWWTFFRPVTPRRPKAPKMYTEAEFAKTIEDFRTLDNQPESDPWPSPREGELIDGLHCYLGGDFGTAEEPVLVPSRMDHRVVGCTGGNGRDHELGFFLLRAGPVHRCPECGQCFALDTVHPGHRDHPDHRFYEAEREVWDLIR